MLFWCSHYMIQYDAAEKVLPVTNLLGSVHGFFGQCRKSSVLNCPTPKSPWCLGDFMQFNSMQLWLAEIFQQPLAPNWAKNQIDVVNTKQLAGLRSWNVDGWWYHDTASHLPARHINKTLSCQSKWIRFLWYILMCVCEFSANLSTAVSCLRVMTLLIAVSYFILTAGLYYNVK